MTMHHFNVVMPFLLLLGFPFHPTVVAQDSTVAPPNFWKISDMQDSNISMGEGSAHILYVLVKISVSYRTYFGFYTVDGHSFILAVTFWGPQAPVIWSANPDNPVSHNAILNFTREGDLILHNGDGTTIWSTATESKSVAGMDLDISGNIVLFDQNNSPVWQSFDHPTDTLVMGQSLSEWNGLRLGFPDKIFSLPSTSSQQFMRLESDGHLRLYEVQEFGSARMLFDVLSAVMKFCDYPLACGDYSVCNNGQCSCPSLSYFRFQNERLPAVGCIPLSSISCDHAHDHQLVPLNNVSYFSYSTFQSLATSVSSENVCVQSCSMDCSCKVVLFQNYGPRYDAGYCLLLSEQKLILFAEDSTNRFSAFVKIKDNRSRKRRIIIAVVSTVAGFSVTSILFCVFVWKRCKKEEEQLLDGIPGTPKRFSFDELKVATRHFSVKLGSGGFGSVFEGKIGKETIAVKRLEGVEQGMEEFLAEVKTIGRMHNLNLVRLVGFCAEKSHKLLVYEFLKNGSLDKWIFDKSPVFTLSWKTRLNIIIGIARGLFYLHEECKEKIAHLDIKPQNILLDDKFDANSQILDSQK
ncbi:hypothetical protein ACP70R_047825 [Stipagrostis hirtigluma subsp. patula]